MNANANNEGAGQSQSQQRSWSRGRQRSSSIPWRRKFGRSTSCPPDPNILPVPQSYASLSLSLASQIEPPSTTVVPLKNGGDTPPQDVPVQDGTGTILPHEMEEDPDDNFIYSQEQLQQQQQQKPKRKGLTLTLTLVSRIRNMASGVGNSSSNNNNNNNNSNHNNTPTELGRRDSDIASSSFGSDPIMTNESHLLTESSTGMERSSMTDDAHTIHSPQQNGLDGTRSQSPALESSPSLSSSSSSSVGMQPVVSNTRKEHSRNRNKTRRRSSSLSSSSSSSSNSSSQAPQVPLQPANLLVFVTSVRSDQYPDLTHQLPKSAPNALKVFHELATAWKDAHIVMQVMPQRPPPISSSTSNNATNHSLSNRQQQQQQQQQHALDSSIQMRENALVLFEFMRNLEYLIGLVNEIVSNPQTRAALKADASFKPIRNVIKWCTKLMETNFLVERERRSFPKDDPPQSKNENENGEDPDAMTLVTGLQLRLIAAHQTRDVRKLRSWNGKLTKAVASVFDGIPSTTSSGGGGTTGTGGATMSQDDDDFTDDETDAKPSPQTSSTLSFEETMEMGSMIPSPSPKSSLSQPTESNLPYVQSRAQCMNVICRLWLEKQKKDMEGRGLRELLPSWCPKAEVPHSAPKLPMEYMHRHALMNQVVDCLLDRTVEEIVTTPPISENERPEPTLTEQKQQNEPLQTATNNESTITSITSMHRDKVGNGKTTLAVSVIQTVEIRERFPDGIAWIRLGRGHLKENDVRRLYEELYRQLLRGTDAIADSTRTTPLPDGMDAAAPTNEGLHQYIQACHDENDQYWLRRLQSGGLQGLREDFGKVLARRKILICLDDVYRAQDVSWFNFGSLVQHSSQKNRRKSGGQRPKLVNVASPFRLLITTRVPELLGSGAAHEVFVSLLTEDEAAKILLCSAGRRLRGVKESRIFEEARSVAHGAGNAPLALRLAGGMLRYSNRNWNLSSPSWTRLVEESKMHLIEASHLQSFEKSLARIVDLCFTSAEDLKERATLRRCFVTFAVVFRENDWIHDGRGIPRPVLAKLFETVLEASSATSLTAEHTIEILEALNLLQRARHGSRPTVQVKNSQDNIGGESSKGSINSNTDNTIHHATLCYLMHPAIHAIGQEMATRSSPSFIPPADQSSMFKSEREAEKDANDGFDWLKTIANKLDPTFKPGTKSESKWRLDERYFHVVMVVALAPYSRVNSVAGSMEEWKEWRMSNHGLGDSNHKDETMSMEEYIIAQFPSHLIRAKAWAGAGTTLLDFGFIGRRVIEFEGIEATRKHLCDLKELRNGVQKKKSGSKSSNASGIESSSSLLHESGVSLDAATLEQNTDAGSGGFDLDDILRNVTRRTLDEVHEAADSADDPLMFAVCLSLIGKFLLESSQPHAAMLQLEEAASIYRNILGTSHVDVARALNAVGKAWIQLGEVRVGATKLNEAAQIYGACQQSTHRDAISNKRLLRTLETHAADLKPEPSIVRSPNTDKMELVFNEEQPGSESTLLQEKDEKEFATENAGKEHKNASEDELEEPQTDNSGHTLSENNQSSSDEIAGMTQVDNVGESDGNEANVNMTGRGVEYNGSNDVNESRVQMPGGDDTSERKNGVALDNFFKGHTLQNDEGGNSSDNSVTSMQQEIHDDSQYDNEGSEDVMFPYDGSMESINNSDEKAENDFVKKTDAKDNLGPGEEIDVTQSSDTKMIDPHSADETIIEVTQSDSSAENEVGMLSSDQEEIESLHIDKVVTQSSEYPKEWTSEGVNVAPRDDLALVEKEGSNVLVRNMMSSKMELLKDETNDSLIEKVDLVESKM